jgi:hypothetical protein
MQRQSKHSFITIEKLLGHGVLNAFSVRGPCRSFIGDNEGRFQNDPCEGGVEYLHRDPASRRRGRKGKSKN